SVDVEWDQFIDTNGKPFPDSTYRYTEAADASGTFEFVAEANIHGAEKPGEEMVRINSRWQGDGAGRSDVILSGNEISADLSAAGLSESSVQASQCWDELF